jgi:hypothetical protein
VSTHITRDRPEEDHGNHNTQEDNNDDRVHETEPMNLFVKDVKVIIPPGCLVSQKKKKSQLLVCADEDN